MSNPKGYPQGLQRNGGYNENDPDVAFKRTVRIINRRLKAHIKQMDKVDPEPLSQEILQLCRIVASWKQRPSEETKKESDETRAALAEARALAG